MDPSKRARIAVLTVNPGIDRTMYFDKPLARGEVNRAASTELHQGCKGANAAIVMARLGADVTYLTFSGGAFGELYESFLEKEGIPTVTVKTEAGVRLNVKLSDAEGRFTECNQAGGPISEQEKAAMLETLDKAEYDCLYLAGSLPRGLGLDFYADCTALAKKRGARVVADCDGALLERTLEATPHLVKPNESEFCALITQGDTLEQKIAIFKQRYKGTALLLSLGEKGAVFAKGQEMLHAQPPAVPVQGTVAAGDTLLAAFTVATLRGYDMKKALEIASAAAAAKVQLRGTALPTAEQMARGADEISVTQFKD